MGRLVASFFAVILAAGAAAGEPRTVREVRLRNLAPTSALPADLTAPEGKTRWQLESLAPGETATIAIVRDEQGFKRGDRVYSGADAARWLLPDQDPSQMKMGATALLRFDEAREGLIDHVVAEVATVGIGWAHLPTAPAEVVLQRVLVSRQRAGEKAMRPELLVHRWVSPREGVLVEVSGPASSDGRTRLTIDRVEVVESVLSGASTLKIYADQIYRGTYVDIKYGYDARGVNPLPVSSIVPDPGINNICDLANLNTWNFSGITTGKETATTDVPINSAETCNSLRCGYTNLPSGAAFETAILERLDSDLGVGGTVRKDHQVVQRENQATGVTFWLRAGTQKEGAAGIFGTGETRFCFNPEVARNAVPIWKMAHNDAGGWYTQAGDAWTSDPLGSICQQDFSYGFSGCGSGGTNLYAKACTDGSQSFAGAQFSKVIKGGVTVLPSGHTFNALLLRNTTEYCTYIGSSCSVFPTPVRTIVYFWQAPFVGSVGLLRGPQRQDFTAAELTAMAETPCTNFTTVEFTDISYGLFPPVSITAGATTGTTVSLSWNPGNDTHRLVGYKIYWDSDSGSSSAYAFNSVANAGQVSFVGTTATISGLTSGTTYYFTVTSLSDFEDPHSHIVTRYESIRYPTTVSGDPSFSYPVEVAATTTGGTCIPSSPVANLTVGKGVFPNIHVCWTSLADPCVVGYDVLASSVPGFGVAGSVGATTCWDGDPPAANLILLQVRARGTGGNGP